MATFNYTKIKNLSLGNRKGYLYEINNVHSSGNKLFVSLRKITDYEIYGDNIKVKSISEKSGNGTCASLTLVSKPESSGKILVAGY